MGDVRPDALSPEAAAAQQRLENQFKERVAWDPPFRGQLGALVGGDDLLDVLRFAKLDPELQFRVFGDVTAADYLDRLPRFDVVYHLFSLKLRVSLRVKTQVDVGQSVPSVTTLWQGANYPEREVYDMFGIRITGHPNLERIIMPEDYPGYPLRRDFSIGEEAVDFDIPHRKRFSHATE